MSNKETILISDHFDFKKIFKFTLSPILMMVFISLYGIVDGFFISNFAGEDFVTCNNAYSGVNVIMPVIMIIGGIGFMFGTGGSALCGKYLGEQNKKKANDVFSMTIETTIIVGIILSIGGFFLIEPIAKALGNINPGTTDAMVEEAIKYGRTLSLGQVFFMLQNVFQSFIVTDEKPKLGFIYILIAGITNMILDALFIAVFHWGVIGAAIATIIGYIAGSILPLIHFIKRKDENITLHLFTKIDLKTIFKCCFNGSSEFVNNISSSVVGLIFNIQLLKYYGQNGVSAYGTFMYISFIFCAIFVGYSIGMAPVTSYHYGAQNKEELTSILKKSLLILTIFSLSMFILSEIFGPLFSMLYVGKDETLLELTTLAFHIFSIMFLFCGFSIFLSAFFTALNNGLISALISFLRTLVFNLISIFVLPLIFGEVGLWFTLPISEFISMILSIIFLIIYKDKYGYWLPKIKRNN